LALGPDAAAAAGSATFQQVRCSAACLSAANMLTACRHHPEGLRLPLPKSVLDKDLKKVVRIEHATQDLTRSLTTPGLLIVFLLGTVVLASVSSPTVRSATSS
jgi:hypothetical protein